MSGTSRPPCRAVPAWLRHHARRLLIDAAFYTWREAAIGFALGTIIGIALATLFVHSGLAERAFLPLGHRQPDGADRRARPIARRGPRAGPRLGRRHRDVPHVLPGHDRRDPRPAFPGPARARAHALVRGVEAATFWKVRLPASVPYLFTALKIAAVASIVGAIIGEGPGGVKNGLGRAIVVYFQQYITGPEKLWATIIAAALTGIAFFLVIRVVEVVMLRGRQSMEA